MNEENLKIIENLERSKNLMEFFDSEIWKVFNFNMNHEKIEENLMNAKIKFNSNWRKISVMQLQKCSLIEFFQTCCDLQHLKNLMECFLVKLKNVCNFKRWKKCEEIDKFEKKILFD
jgi:hypothetical protein